MFAENNGVQSYYCNDIRALSYNIHEYLSPDKKYIWLNLQDIKRFIEKQVGVKRLLKYAYIIKGICVLKPMFTNKTHQAFFIMMFYSNIGTVNKNKIKRYACSYNVLYDDPWIIDTYDLRLSFCIEQGICDCFNTQYID